MTTIDRDATTKAVIARLEAEGFTVLRTKSYRAAQERQRVAVALLRSEQDHNEHTRQWALKAFDEQRRYADRCTYLYGLAASLGATETQLRGPS